MENKLEQLLNKLIEKGWEPRGKNAYNCCDNAKRIWYEGGEESYRDYIEITPRKLTSKESGLWQFVCENKLIKRPKGEAPEDVRVRRYVETMGIVWNRCFGKRKPEFYIIESALKDESELESFILDNIKV